MSINGETVNVFLSGVGGQGTILASNILGQVLLDAGYDVKKAEVHGMAQRGGDVTTHFRFGRKVYSPLIREGEVDYLISFELLEALRYINWVKPELESGRWTDVIKSILPEKLHAINVRAFEKGRAAV
jgi:indolepyruvate ferredoxin oxidoreductase beta subunit